MMSVKRKGAADQTVGGLQGRSLYKYVMNSLACTFQFCVFGALSFSLSFLWGQSSLCCSFHTDDFLVMGMN